MELAAKLLDECPQVSSVFSSSTPKVCAFALYLLLRAGLAFRFSVPCHRPPPLTSVRSADFKGEPGLKHRAVIGPNLNCHSARISAIARAAARMLPDGIPRQISYRLARFFRS